MNPTTTSTTQPKLPYNSDQLLAQGNALLQSMGKPAITSSTTIPANSTSTNRLQVGTTSTPTTANDALGAHLDSTFSSVPTGYTKDASGNLVQNTQTDSGNGAITSKMTDLLNKLSGKSQVNNDLNTQLGVDQKQQDYIDATNAYNSKKLSYQQQSEKLLNAPGVTREQAQQQVNETSRANNADLANLSVIAQSAQGNFQGAMDTVKRKLDAQFEPIQSEIDNLSKFYQLNQNDLTDSQKTQLQAKIQSQQSDKAAVQTAASDIHDRLAQNNAPASVYNAIDSIITNYSSGKISAQEATNQMYQATGQYGSKNKYSVVTNPFTGAQSAFDTVTGTFKGANGNTYSPSQVAGSPSISTEAVNSSQPTIINGTVGHPTTGNVLVDTAQQLVDGNEAPSQIGKGKTSLAFLAKANELSLAQTGKPFSPVDAEAAYKFRNSGTYQKFIAAAPVAVSTINEITGLASKLKLSGPDALNSTWLKLTGSGLNPFASQEDRSNAKQLNSLLSVSGDDIGLLLGSGSGSDFKTKLGAAIFDANGNLKTTQDLASTIKDRVQSKLNDYYRIAGVKDPSIYAQRDTQAISGTSKTSGSSSNTSSDMSNLRSKYGY